MVYGCSYCECNTYNGWVSHCQKPIVVTKALKLAAKVCHNSTGIQVNLIKGRGKRFEIPPIKSRYDIDAGIFLGNKNSHIAFSLSTFPF